MPDEHDHEPGSEGPHRPVDPRRRTAQTLHPSPAGTILQNQKLQSRQASSDADHVPPRDPRFADAPLSDAEKKALYDAHNFDEACKVLGRMQEERMKDGRLPPAVKTEYKPVPEINRHMSVDQQIAKGLRPTAEELAHMQAAPSAAARQDRTTEFLKARTAHNKELFDNSRKWSAGMHRQSHPDGPSPDAERQRGPHGAQAWRADITELRELVYFPARDMAAATAGRPPARDTRFEGAPVTEAEIKALRESKSPEAAAQLLEQFQNARVDDGRLPKSPSTKALIHQAFGDHELARLGLTPTARDLAYLAAGAANGQEMERTKEFIAERQAQNTRWHLDSQYAARQQEQLARDRGSSFWYERNLKSAFPERDVRTEKAERRTDLQQRREQTEQRREGGPRDNPDHDHGGRDGGGRER